tara:strand:- start:1534 stop:2217 length:684 start_codon:yes stop_codon:yes gene_type:complete
MAFKMKGMHHGKGTGSYSAFKQNMKVNEDLSINMNTGEVTSKKQDAANKSGAASANKPLGPPKGKMGSQYRKDEYDARGWKYDDTIAGYNRDGSKKETPVSIARKPKPTPKPKVTKKFVTKKKKVVKKGEEKKEKIATKAAVKTGEVVENVDRKTAKLSKRQARKEYGRGSKEFLEAKKVHLQSKEADRQGKQGGRKQGIIKKLSSKINKKRQEKNQAKLDKLNEKK